MPLNSKAPKPLRAMANRGVGRADYAWDVNHHVVCLGCATR
jgi:hypothetical protein